VSRILIIDDEGVLRRVARLALEAAGHEVDEAADGDEGLRAYRARPADVVLCDLFMPGREGLETIPELRRAGARVVAVSGGGLKGAVSVLDVAVALGAVSALPKPFGRKELLAAVEGALSRPG
jgi:CheY-like chemotaxis protein